jgi:hypothetical protein
MVRTVQFEIIGLSALRFPPLAYPVIGSFEQFEAKFRANPTKTESAESESPYRPVSRERFEPISVIERGMSDPTT